MAAFQRAVQVVGVLQTCWPRRWPSLQQRVLLSPHLRAEGRFPEPRHRTQARPRWLGSGCPRCRGSRRRAIRSAPGAVLCKRKLLTVSQPAGRPVALDENRSGRKCDLTQAVCLPASAWRVNFRLDGPQPALRPTPPSRPTVGRPLVSPCRGQHKVVLLGRPLIPLSRTRRGRSRTRLVVRHTPNSRPRRGNGRSAAGLARPPLDAPA